MPVDITPVLKEWMDQDELVSQAAVHNLVSIGVGMDIDAAESHGILLAPVMKHLGLKPCIQVVMDLVLCMYTNCKPYGKKVPSSTTIRKHSWYIRRLITTWSRWAKRGSCPRSEGQRLLFEAAGIPIPERSESGTTEGDEDEDEYEGMEGEEEDEFEDDECVNGDDVADEDGEDEGDGCDDHDDVEAEKVVTTNEAEVTRCDERVPTHSEEVPKCGDQPPDQSEVLDQPDGQTVPTCFSPTLAVAMDVVVTPPPKRCFVDRRGSSSSILSGDKVADPKLAELQALREIEEELKHLTALHLMKQPTIGTMGNDSMDPMDLMDTFPLLPAYMDDVAENLKKTLVFEPLPSSKESHGDESSPKPVPMESDGGESSPKPSPMDPLLSCKPDQSQELAPEEAIPSQHPTPSQPPWLRTLQ
ncbi:unnamed protein product [Durusdinium trenchii]|uniref:Uncharacterized protein n=2 Tax=Durusdinium trenchii TaxID=1381693 RepID=A0ABP0SA07_9DINO